MAEDMKSVRINYIKTHNYRSYHVDGIHGGLTPRLQLYLEPFIERLVTPNIIEHDLGDDGRLVGEGKIIESKQGGIREIEFGMIMDIECAKAIHAWLGTKINEYNQIVTSIKGAKN